MTQDFQWPAAIGELDLHLISEGRHERLWRCSARIPAPTTAPTGPTDGTSFAVWAPNAHGVRVAGDFNYWGGDEHAMRPIGSGVWDLFVPGGRAGHRLQAQGPGPRRHVAREGRSDGVRHRGAAGDRLGRHRLDARVERRRVDRRPRRPPNR